ncbi:g1083 [Coccomyxa elongata]
MATDEAQVSRGEVATGDEEQRGVLSMHGPRTQGHVVDPVGVEESMVDRELQELVAEADGDDVGVSLGDAGHFTKVDDRSVC